MKIEMRPCCPDMNPVCDGCGKKYESELWDLRRAVKLYQEIDQTRDMIDSLKYPGGSQWRAAELERKLKKLRQQQIELEHATA